jgi:hypothetical protein
MSRQKYAPFSFCSRKGEFAIPMARNIGPNKKGFQMMGTAFSRAAFSMRMTLR